MIPYGLSHVQCGSLERSTLGILGLKCVRQEAASLSPPPVSCCRNRPSIAFTQYRLNHRALYHFPEAVRGCSIRLHWAGRPACDGNRELEDDSQDRAFARALLLCFLASQNRSLFAAKCFVETVLEMYRRGFTLDDIKLSVTLATLSTADPLKPISQDILLAWCAIIMMTLRTVGVPLLPEGERRRSRGSGGISDEDSDRMTQGLESFAHQCVQRYLSGTDIFRLQLLQSMQPTFDGDPEASGESPAMYVMQQNTRLAIITLDIVRSMQLPTSVPLRRTSTRVNGDEEERDDGAAPLAPPTAHPIGYAAGFLVKDSPGSESEENLTGNERAAAVRAAAVRLLISYNGGALGYLRPARAFIEEALDCYCAGWTAEEIFNALHDEEFAQSGGVMRFGVVELGERHVSATLFARWLSVVYMTLALMGVTHPGAAEQIGWAWIEGASAAASTASPSSGTGTGGSGGSEIGSSTFNSATEAHGIAYFVGATLRLAAQSDEESEGDEVGEQEEGKRVASAPSAIHRPGDPQMDDAVAEGDYSVEGFAARGFEDPELLRTSSFALILSQQISMVRLTRLHVLELERRGHLLSGNMDEHMPRRG